jgi:hypothetical protein
MKSIFNKAGYSLAWKKKKNFPHHPVSGQELQTFSDYLSFIHSFIQTFTKHLLHEPICQGGGHKQQRTSLSETTVYQERQAQQSPA